MRESTMAIKTSNLRKDIYRLLDQVLETGKPLEVSRKGEFLKISRDDQRGQKMKRLVPHDCIVGDPEALVEMDWTDTWEGGDL